MLVKLALGNVRKSSRDYLIYFVTIAFSIALLYAFNTVDTHIDMLPHRRRMIQTIDEFMNILSYVLMGALTLLIIYANNYLIRRRSKEFALYQIFGMRRRKVAIILTIETFLSSLLALIVGLVFGVLLSQFLVFVTGRILQETVSNYHFIFRPTVVLTTVIAFGIIFLLTLILNLITLRRFQLIDLVKYSRTNEVSRVQSKWVTFGLFIGGLVLIGVAYWRLINIGYPFQDFIYGDNSENAATWSNFWVTTALVCVGTYLLFYSLGGVLLLFARTSRTLYWRGLNMFTVREFTSKIRSSALSMATISIILFLMLSVIVPAFGVSTSLHASVYKNAPYSATFTLSCDTAKDDETMVSWHNSPISLDKTRNILDKKGIFSDSTEVNKGVYSGTFMGKPAHMVLTPSAYIDYVASDDQGNSFVKERSVPTLAQYIKASGYDTSQWKPLVAAELNSHDLYSFEVVSVSTYNGRRTLAGLEPMTVGEGEYAVSSSFSFSGLRDMYVSALDSGLEIEIAGHTVKPAGGASVALDDSAAAIFTEDFTANNTGVLIVSDSLFIELENRDDSYKQVHAAVNFDGNSKDIFTLAGEFPDDFEYFYESFMNETGSGEFDSWLMNASSTQVGVAERAIEFLGIVMYISVYVSFVLAIMSAAMLAIQILSGVSEAGPRYRHLSQIGASHRDENRSLAVQVASYFLLPLLVGACHAWVAVREALEFIEFLMPVSITLGALVAATLVVAIYGVYALVSYWSAKSVIAPEANLTER